MQPRPCTCNATGLICALCALTAAAPYADAVILLEGEDISDHACPPTLRSGQLAGVLPRAREDAYWDRQR